MTTSSASSDKSFSKFLLLWTGQLISAIGNGLTSFGLGVYVYEQTGKASAVALVTLLAYLPYLLLSPPAGVLADRYDRRLMMILGDSLSALGLVYIWVCMLFGTARLWQICIGVTISSVFSSLMEPAYKASVTDLLSEEEYAKASGLIQAAGSAKYLISPFVAGLLLMHWDIKLLLIIDIATFFETVASTFAVSRSIHKHERKQASPFLSELLEGWRAVSSNKGVLVLVLITSLLTFFLGFIQTLSSPMILAFDTVETLGTAQTICACGMLISSIVIGIVPIKSGYVKALWASLFFMGIFMALFGLRENMVLICIAGFLFFATLPFANTSLDVLVRSNIENTVQGRVWGLVSLISQMGYVVAYAISGVMADYLFTPFLLSDGALADSVGRIIGTGPGRGIGLLILISGVLICVTALILSRIRSVRALEDGNNLLQCSTDEHS